MALEIRTITDDEVAAYRETLMQTFGVDADVDEGGAARHRKLIDLSQSWAAVAPQWTFASADEAAVHTLGDGVGFEFSRANGQISHNLRTVVADASGRVRRIFRGNHWTPQELAAAVRDAGRAMR